MRIVSWKLQFFYLSLGLIVRAISLIPTHGNIMEDIRYIDNPFLTMFVNIVPDKRQVNTILLNVIDYWIKGSKMPTLQAIASQPDESYEAVTAYDGVSGYAYTLVRLYRFFQANRQAFLHQLAPGKSFGDSELNRLTDVNFYLQLATQQIKHQVAYLKGKSIKKNEPPSFYMSPLCTWVSGMHVSYLKRAANQFREFEGYILKIGEGILNGGSKFEYELLYGIPGYLAAIIQLQRTYRKCPENQYRTNYKKIIEDLAYIIIREGTKAFEQVNNTKINPEDQLPANFRLVYMFGGKQYLGGAHGLAGNLNVLLNAVQLLESVQFQIALEKVVTPSIIHLLRHYINGNFATSTGSTKTKLIHFCHGAPGVVHCLARFCNVFTEKAVQFGVRTVLKAALETIWREGLLKKGFGLCHGISGNAYAFLAPCIQEALPDKTEELKKKALLFALAFNDENINKQIRAYDFQGRFKRGVPDYPFSLMLGAAGDICFLIDCLNGQGYFPGYDS